MSTRHIAINLDQYPLIKTACEHPVELQALIGAAVRSSRARLDYLLSGNKGVDKQRETAARIAIEDLKLDYAVGEFVEAMDDNG